MNVIRRAPLFRLPRGGALVKMREVGALAVFLSEHAGFKMVMEGVKRARADGTVVDYSAPPTPQVTPPIVAASSHGVPVPVIGGGVYVLPRKKGLAHAADLAALVRWLKDHAGAPVTSPDFKLAGDAAAAFAPPWPEPRRGGRALLYRPAFAAFVAELGRRLGFRVASDEISGARDMADGVHLRRRVRPAPYEIKLYLQVRVSGGFAWQCVIGIWESPGHAWLVKKVVEHWENGDITTTWTAGGEIIVNGESTCPAIDPVSDYDEEFDYGAYISTDDPVYSSANDPAAIKDAAAAAAVLVGSPYMAGLFSWMSDETPPGGGSFDLGSWTGDEVSAEVTSFDYRWLAVGADLTVDWNQGGGAHSVALTDGVWSAWYSDSLPEAESTPDQITDIAITVD